MVSTEMRPALAGAEAERASANVAIPTGRVRLDYLDGLRGLAAVYVLLGHIYIALVYFTTEIHLPRGVVALMKLFNIGQTAVDIFIVLSGYCLMLPIARAGGAIKGGLKEYARRRALRIIPPYYAALVLSLGIREWMASAALPVHAIVDYPGTLVAHLLLIHNWNPVWIQDLDPPMWSVAVEWQIYFVFPLLLLPLWRRFGPGISALVGLTLGLALHVLPAGKIDYTFPWYIGLFAMGNAAASINFSNKPSLVQLRNRVPWGWLSLAIWAPTVAFVALTPGWYKSHQWLADPVIGLATATLLVSCTRRSLEPERGKNPVLSLLSCRPAVAVGAFSYSLYLVHYPVLALFFHTMMRVPMSSMARALVMYGVCFPLLLAVSYAFYRAFERPFLPAHATPAKALASSPP